MLVWVGQWKEKLKRQTEKSQRIRDPLDWKMPPFGSEMDRILSKKHGKGEGTTAQAGTDSRPTEQSSSPSTISRRGGSHLTVYLKRTRSVKGKQKHFFWSRHKPRRRFSLLPLALLLCDVFFPHYPSASPPVCHQWVTGIPRQWSSQALGNGTGRAVPSRSEHLLL